MQRMDLMERSSSMGVFVRKLVLGVTVADFWGACSLLEGLQALAAAFYRSLGGVYCTNPQAIEHATGWGTHTGPPLPQAADSHDVDMAGVEASATTAAVARDPLAAAEAALARQPQYTTRAQLRAAVQRQLEELDEAKLATTPRHELVRTTTQEHIRTMLAYPDLALLQTGRHRQGLASPGTSIARCSRVAGCHSRPCWGGEHCTPPLACSR